ncbi:MAG: nicotinate-nucleotide adenylyltransferase [Rhodothermales bacterium]|jgi:nicotinate-nucleotide adenylyltransferase
MRVGLFGGTFNPPHLGHRVIAEQAVEALGLSRLIWMPARQSPLKDAAAQVSAAHRLAMTSLCSADHPAFVVSDLEIGRPPPSFTVDTVALLAADHPDWDLHLLIGEDSWQSFDLWREPERILSLARVAVYPRGAAETETGAGPAGSRSATVIPSPRLDISSTEIRRRLRTAEPVAGLVSKDVLDYIRAHELYVLPA